MGKTRIHACWQSSIQGWIYPILSSSQQTLYQKCIFGEVLHESLRELLSNLRLVMFIAVVFAPSILWFDQIVRLLRNVINIIVTISWFATLFKIIQNLIS